MTARYDQFASDLAGHASIGFSSIEENEQALISKGINQPMKQLGRGPYRSKLASEACGLVELYSDRFNVPLEMYLEPPSNTVGILFPRTSSERFLANGVDIGKDGILFLADGTGADIVIPALAGSDCILMSRHRYSELQRVYCPDLQDADITDILSCEPTKRSQLQAAIVRLIRSGDIARGEELMSRVMAELIFLQADAKGLNSTPGSSAIGRAHIARSAKAYIDENFRNKIRIEDVCRATGAGARSLQRAFCDYFNLSFSEYLRAVRLNSLSRDLLSASPETATVAGLALDNGFGHLGRVSVEFRQHFGRSPNEVLRERH